jgi:hypothetical protein
MDKKNKLISEVSWNINCHPDEACTYVKDESFPLSDSILNIKLRSKNLISLLWLDSKPVFTVEFTGSTFKDWMNTLYEGLNREIIKEHISIESISIVYALIGSFLRENDRLKMVKKFEANKLKYKELLGDHCYFEGGLHLEKKIWTYSLGS